MEKFDFGKYKGFDIHSLLFNKPTFDIIQNYIQRYFELVMKINESVIGFPMPNQENVNLELNNPNIQAFRNLLEKHPDGSIIKLVFTNEYIILDLNSYPGFINNWDETCASSNFTGFNADNPVQNVCENFIIYFLNNLKLKTGRFDIRTINGCKRKPLQLDYDSVFFKNGLLFFKLEQFILGKKYVQWISGSQDFFKSINCPMSSLMQKIDLSKPYSKVTTISEQDSVSDEVSKLALLINNKLNIELRKSEGKIEKRLVKGKANHYFLDEPEQDSFTKKFLYAMGDYSYIKWCIKNVDSFYIDPNALDKGFNDYTIGFKAHRIGKGLIKYSINMTTDKIFPNESITELNNLKFNDSQLDSTIDMSDWHIYNWEGDDSPNYYNNRLDMDQQSPEFWDNL